jgi:hypothetical protein
VTFVTRTAALAEAAALDARGQVTIIGLEPQVWVPAALPAAINFALVIIAESDGEDEDMPADDEASQVTTTVTDDQGTVEFFNKGSFTAHKRPDPTLPPRVQFVFTLALTVDVPGAHTIRVIWNRTDRDQLEWVRELRVRAPA